MEERGLGRGLGRALGGGGGIKHLSDASLMARHSGPLPLWGARDSKKHHTHLSMSICPFSYMSSYTSLPYSSTLCPLSHLHNLACHAFVPLCLFFSAYSAIFVPICCSLPGLMEWKEKTMLCHSTIS